MSYKLVPETEGIHAFFEGDIHDHDFLSLTRDLFKNHCKSTYSYQIANFENARTVAISPENLQKMVEMDSERAEHVKSIKCAIVTDKALFKSIIEIYKQSMAGSTWKIKTFDSESEARTWINEEQNIAAA